MDHNDKYIVLKEKIGRYKSAVIAFSGGVDSTLLAYAAKDALGSNVLLVTASSSTYPFYELEEAKKMAILLDLKHEIIISEELDIPSFTENKPDRCYYCKAELFKRINHVADKEGYDVVFEGSNADDSNDFRPGRKAIKELGVISPLNEALLKKDEIRKLSHKFKLPTADKPSYACLASRFPYGEAITKEKLDRVGQVEQKIRNLGFNQFRVRSHGDLARIELGNKEMEKGWKNRSSLISECKKSGFIYISMDLEGYRTGAMNESLSEKELNLS
jgi:uncharacterized protein